VVGSAKEPVASATCCIDGGDEIRVGKLLFEALETPGSPQPHCSALLTPTPTAGHTGGHLAFHLKPSTGGYAGAVFTGDCLFIGGIGKLFEGNGLEMSRSLATLARLPSDTWVFPGHEYTLQNLEVLKHLPAF